MTEADRICLACLAFTCLGLGLIAGLFISEAKYRNEAIQHGYAEYDATTGEWQCKGDNGKD